MEHDIAQSSALGKQTDYNSDYNPNVLFTIAREPQRENIHIQSNAVPFYGFDYWNHYEVSWLNSHGKPIVATAEIVYDCRSLYLIESKSMKLYFNSLNNTMFPNTETVQFTIQQDLAQRLLAPVIVNVVPYTKWQHETFRYTFSGTCLDTLDIACSTYTVEPNYLMTTNTTIEETVYSDLLKSNCLVTHQPDWGSVQITYTGRKIIHEGLLRYLISFRNHNEFHEQCIERIFMDIKQRCQPECLTVYGRYTRRGGLDINPYRSTQAIIPTKTVNYRLWRQ